MSQADAQREFALEVVKKLRDSGYEALWAGGCVRDQLLGRDPKDYDVATSAHPDQVRELFGRRRTLAIGAAFGVISILGGRQREPIEVATFRSDGVYVDGRHPEEVVFTTAEEDAQRRDFTINGLFFDPLEERIIDYVDGQEDLRRKMVRAIGDPHARFAEDKLRMLRAVRFATTFGFQIEPTTFSAIQSMAAEVNIVSAERIGSELGRILVHPQRGLGLQLLRDSGLLAKLMPEAAPLLAEEPLRWQETLASLERLASDSLPVAFATLLCSITDAKGIKNWGRRFRFSNKEIGRAAWLIGNLSFVADATEVPWPQLQQRLVHEGAADLLAMAVAVLGNEHPGVAACKAHLQLPADQLNPPLLVTGDDLVARGLRPGRHFAALLEHLRDAQLEGEIATQQQAFSMVDQWMRERPKE